MKIFRNNKFTSVGPDNLDNIEGIYTCISSKYESRYSGLSGKYFNETEVSLAISSVDFSDKRILDIGTGTGRFIDYIINQAESVVGIDISKGMVGYCKKKFSEQEKVTIQEMNSLHLDFEDNTFDIVLNFGYESITDLTPYFKEVNRVLKKGGIFIFTCLNDVAMFNCYDRIAMKVLNIYKEFPRIKFGAKEIKVILEQTGFKISKCVSNFCLVPPYLLPFKRFKRLDQIVPVFTCFINLLIWFNKICSKSTKLGYELIWHAQKQ